MGNEGEKGECNMEGGLVYAAEKVVCNFVIRCFNVGFKNHFVANNYVY